MSFNYHQDHFGRTWDLVLADGAPAHTGCVAFGMDRLAVAMFATHGADVDAWPKSVAGAGALGGIPGVDGQHGAGDVLYPPSPSRNSTIAATSSTSARRRARLQRPDLPPCPAP